MCTHATPIRVLASNSPAQQVKTLATSSDTPSSMPVTVIRQPGVLELEAESVAFVVCARRHHLR